MPSLAATLESDSHQLIAADLRSLIARIESSMRLIDAAMARASRAQDDNGDQAGSSLVLDDVTPCYAPASAALTPAVCRPRLGAAIPVESGGLAETDATDPPHPRA